MRADPDFDARMADIARLISPQADVREMIDTVVPRPAQHDSIRRLTPAELMATMRVNEATCSSVPRNIILLDDMITTGCSFIACLNILQTRFPGVPISGIFAARRVIDHVLSPC